MLLPTYVIYENWIRGYQLTATFVSDNADIIVLAMMRNGI